MNTPYSIATFAEAAAGRRSTRRSAYPLFMTKTVLEEMVRTIGGAPPEAGGMLLRPALDLAVDTFVYDVRGSAHASAAVYRPDAEGLTAVVHEFLDRPNDAIRFIVGFAHSHPNGFGWPSSASGRGLGDLAYAAECFSTFVDLAAFAMPILTNTGTRSQPVIWPWIVLRDAPNEPLYADVIVVEDGAFPAYPFSLASEVAPSSAPIPSVAIDGNEIAARSRSSREPGSGLLFRHGEATVEIEVPSVWNHRDTPTIRLHVGDRQVELPVSWSTHPGKRVELRLADAVRRAFLLTKTI